MLFFVTTAVLTAPSLLGNAFIVDRNGRRSRPTPRQQLKEQKHASVTTTLAAAGQAEEAEVVSSSWFDNNDGMADSIFDTIDTDEDGSVSNDELREYLEEMVGVVYSPESTRLLFATLDQNADGCISREEMRFAFSNYDILALYDAFGVTATTTKAKDEKVYTKAIGKIRSNANIDPRASPAMLNMLADVMFDKIDADASGEIDLDELKEHYRDQDENDGNDEVSDSAKSILTALDLNSDGKISREEMRAGFNQFNPKSLSKALGVREAFEDPLSLLTVGVCEASADTSQDKSVDVDSAEMPK